MKLRGANLLELSLSIAFALVVFAITLQLIQESTDRINKGFSFQKFQQTAYQSLIKIHQLNQWSWGSNATNSSILNTNLLKSQPSLQPTTFLLIINGSQLPHKGTQHIFK